MFIVETAGEPDYEAAPGLMFFAETSEEPGYEAAP